MVEVQPRACTCCLGQGCGRGCPSPGCGSGDADGDQDAGRSLQLVIGRLGEFASRVRAGLDGLDWQGRREVIRALVRRIEADLDTAEVAFRIPGAPPPSDDRAHGGSGAGPVGDQAPIRQHRGRSCGVPSLLSLMHQVGTDFKSGLKYRWHWRAIRSWLHCTSRVSLIAAHRYLHKFDGDLMIERVLHRRRLGLSKGNRSWRIKMRKLETGPALRLRRSQNRPPRRRLSPAATK